MKIILIAVSIFLFSCESVNIEKVSLEGIWGNEKDNSELVITKDRAKFDFTCSSAEITQVIPSEFENPLYIDGTFFQQFGNQPDNFDASDYTFPVVFRFSILGDKLNVEIRKKADNSKIGEYEYTKNLNVLVKKCP